MIQNNGSKYNLLNQIKILQILLYLIAYKPNIPVHWVILTYLNRLLHHGQTNKENRNPVTGS